MELKEEETCEQYQSMVKDKVVEAEWNELHRLTERDSRLAHYFALLWGLGLLLEYLASSGAKFDVIFLLGDPDFL